MSSISFFSLKSFLTSSTMFLLFFIFFKPWTFYHSLYVVKKKFFFFFEKVYYTPWKTIWKHYFWGSAGDFRQYWDFMNYVNPDKVKLHHFYVLINQFFWIAFTTFFFSYISKFLKIYQPDIIKIIKKDYKKSLWKNLFLSKKSNNMVMNDKILPALVSISLKI